MLPFFSGGPSKPIYDVDINSIIEFFIWSTTSSSSAMLKILILGKWYSYNLKLLLIIFYNKSINVHFLNQLHFISVSSYPQEAEWTPFQT